MSSRRQAFGRRPLGRLVLAAVAVAATLAPPARAARQAPLFVLADPYRDDHGDGTLLYPLRSDLEPGDLDLLELAAYEEDGGTRFEALFARRIRDPGVEAVDISGTPRSHLARLGFYTLNLDLYVDTDRIPGSGEQAMLPGRKAQVHPDSAWEKVVALAPRPNLARSNLVRVVAERYKQEGRHLEGRREPMSDSELRRAVDEELEAKVFFPKQVRVTGRTLAFFVPGHFLGGPARDSWSYVVAVSGAELLQRFRLPFLEALSPGPADGMILPVFPGRPREAFGGGRDGDPLQPPLVDIVVPDGMSQEEVLRDRDSDAGRPARLPGVVPSREAKRR